MEKNAREAFDGWLKNSGITITDFFCLAFINRSTFERLLKGRNFIATQYRVYQMTELDVFKLSDEQVQKYRLSIARKKVDYWDEKIADHFIKEWKVKGMLPGLEYRLTTGHDKYQDRKKLTEKIKKELLHVSESGLSKTVTADKPSSQLESIDIVFINQQFNGLLVSGTEDEIDQFAKKNKNQLNLLYGKLVILLDPKPANAASVMRQKEKLLKS